MYQDVSTIKSPKIWLSQYLPTGGMSEGENPGKCHSGLVRSVAINPPWEVHPKLAATWIHSLRTRNRIVVTKKYVPTRIFHTEQRYLRHLLIGRALLWTKIWNLKDNQ